MIEPEQIQVRAGTLGDGPERHIKRPPATSILAKRGEHVGNLQNRVITGLLLRHSSNLTSYTLHLPTHHPLIYLTTIVSKVGHIHRKPLGIVRYVHNPMPAEVSTMRHGL